MNSKLVSVKVFTRSRAIPKAKSKTCKLIKDCLRNTSFYFAGKIKNTNQISLGLLAHLWEDLLDPPLKEPPSVFAS